MRELAGKLIPAALGGLLAFYGATRAVESALQTNMEWVKTGLSNHENRITFLERARK